MIAITTQLILDDQDKVALKTRRFRAIILLLDLVYGLQQKLTSTIAIKFCLTAWSEQWGPFHSPRMKGLTKASIPWY